MRTATVLSLALAAGWPLTASATTHPAAPPARDPYTAVAQAADTYANLQAVQVVESFSNGTQTTIALRPNSNRMRFASTFGRLDAVALAVARNPAGSPWEDPHAQFTAIRDLGHGTTLGVPVEAYALQSADGTTEELWIDANHRPVQAVLHPSSGGAITVLYGNYDSPPLIATLEP